jgi:hypothetical protein
VSDNAPNPPNPPAAQPGDGAVSGAPAPPTARDTGGAGGPRRVPASVRRQAQRADELQSQMIAEMEAAATAEQAELTAQAELDRVVSQQPQPQQPQPQDSWEHRYRTLQGKYDSEIPHLRAQVQQLEQLIATFQTPAQPPQPQQTPPQAAQPEIPEEDYTTYGPDFVDSTRRWARAELDPEIGDLRRQLAELKAQAQQSTGDRVKDRVRQELDRDPEIGGRWQELDRDPGFNQWLIELDPFSGVRRLDMLRAAYAGGDAVRTGRFFKAYIQEHTDYTQNPSGYQPQTQQPYQPNGGYAGNGAGPVNLADYAAPGRASNATPGPGAPDRRIWTTSEIQTFYDGRLKGRFRGREQEADRMERDIFAAAAEGRVRNA